MPTPGGEAEDDVDHVQERIERPARGGRSGRAGGADLVRLYLDQIAGTPLLSAAEEVELAQRIEAGLYAGQLLAGAITRTDADPVELAELVEDGRRAMKHMVRANLRLVVSVARVHARRGLPLLDLIQEGNLGLIHAVEKFDYRKGYKFSTYASWWLKQAIHRAVAVQTRPVRLPIQVVEELRRVSRLTAALEQDLGREPTRRELAAAADTTVERLDELRRIDRETLSLDMEVGDGGTTTLGHLLVDATDLPTDDVVEARDGGLQVELTLAVLPPREAEILRLRLGLSDGIPRTLKEVGRVVGLCSERVRVLEARALATLRAANDPRALVRAS